MRSISSIEYAELRAFAMLERVGYERTDLYAAAASWGLSPLDFQFSPIEDASEEEVMGAMNSLGVDEVENG